MFLSRADFSSRRTRDVLSLSVAVAKGNRGTEIWDDKKNCRCTGSNSMLELVKLLSGDDDRR